MMIPRLLAATALLLSASVQIGCSTETQTTATTLVQSIPEVAVMATIDSLSKSDADRLRGTLEVRHRRAVYGGAIVPVYWRDDLHADLVVLEPDAGGRVQLLKVDVVRWHRYRIVDGTTNGRPFHREGLVADDD